MLFLTRKLGESIVINDDIVVTVTEIKGNHIKLSFDYPKNVRVLRKEIYDRIQQENQAAAANSQEIKQVIEANFSYSNSEHLQSKKS
ncbi:MAG TPA: carbon storage regulator CsrA [Candidatus Nitrosotenuis sp.]|nr:carbon storage regulator CsrA [Candidatus Nitrosotenuis sp.]